MGEERRGFNKFLYRKLCNGIYQINMQCSKIISLKIKNQLLNITKKIKSVFTTNNIRFSNVYEPIISCENAFVKASKLSSWFISSVKQSFLENFLQRESPETQNLRKILNLFKSNIVDLNRPIIRWLGHSSCFVSAFGINFLTDPVFSDKIGLPFFMLNRKSNHIVTSSSLDPIDIVLISHNHPDHLHFETLNEISKKSPNLNIFIPKGLHLNDRMKKVQHCELEWWEHKEIKIRNVCIKVFSVPSIHHSRTGLFDKNASQWCGWVCVLSDGISKDKVFYFVGDTAFNEDLFVDIRKNSPPIDLSLIPVGAYLPQCILSSVHVNPYLSSMIHRIVNSKLSIACHHSTFRLSDPKECRYFIDDFFKAVKDNESFFLVPIGSFLNW